MVNFGKARLGIIGSSGGWESGARCAIADRTTTERAACLLVSPGDGRHTAATPQKC
jgi:hypothetical protein